jgi:hypothetical protein
MVVSRNMPSLQLLMMLIGFMAYLMDSLMLFVPSLLMLVSLLLLLLFLALLVKNVVVVVCLRMVLFPVFVVDHSVLLALN